MFVKDLQLVANKTILTFPSLLDVLKDTFERVLQGTFQVVFPTFLVTVADFYQCITVPLTLSIRVQLLHFFYKL